MWGRVNVGQDSIKSIQRGMVILNNSNNSNKIINISKVDMAKSIILINVGLYKSSSYSVQPAICSFIDSTNIKISIAQNGGYTYEEIVSWQVIEFKKAKVQRGEFNFNATGEQPVSIYNVNPERSFVLTNCISNRGGDFEINSYLQYNGEHLIFSKINNENYLINWQVIEF